MTEEKACRLGFVFLFFFVLNQVVLDQNLSIKICCFLRAEFKLGSQVDRTTWNAGVSDYRWSQVLPSSQWTLEQLKL